MLIGLVLGAGAGVGTASYREFTDMSARSATQLARATSYPVLASIPTIVLDADTSRRKSMWTWIAAGVGAAGMAGLVVFHVFVMDLYVFWAKLLRWLGV
jgi:hypothetical protein